MPLVWGDNHDDAAEIAMPGSPAIRRSPKKTRTLAVAFLVLVTLASCSPTPMWSGKYHLVNNTGSTITELTASVGHGNDKTWDQTAPGEGWIHPNLGAEFLIVSWKDEAGSHKKRFSFERKVNDGSKADLYVELKPGGNLAWRVIEPPPEDGSVEAIVELVCLYLGYCLVASLVIGVPVGLAALVACGLFIVIKMGVSATVQGLLGDRTVFQFSIREILLLTTVVALVCGWFVTFLSMGP